MALAVARDKACPEGKRRGGWQRLSSPVAQALRWYSDLDELEFCQLDVLAQLRPPAWVVAPDHKD